MFSNHERLFFFIAVTLSAVIVQLHAANSSAASRPPIDAVIPALADLGVAWDDIPAVQPLMQDTAVSFFQQQPHSTTAVANDIPFPPGPFAPTGRFEMLLFGHSSRLDVGPDDLLIGYHTYGILSRNGGRSWHLIESEVFGSSVQQVNMPPSLQDPIFVINGNNYLLRSLDQGQSWQTNIIGGNPYSAIQSVYSPTYEQDKLIFATNGSSLGRSVDQGSSWTANSIPHVSHIVLANNFADSQIMLGRIWDAIYYSENGGYNWQLATGGLHLEYNNRIDDLLFSPNQAVDNTAFAVTRYGVYISRTNGLTWQRFLPFVVKKFALHPHYPYTPTFFMIATVQVEDQQIDVLFRSDDNGQTFHGLAADVTDFGLSRQYATNHSLYAMVPQGLIYSNNNGAAWYIMSQSMGDFYPKQLVPSPNMTVDRTIYLVMARYSNVVDHEVWRTNTLGLTWQKLTIPRASSHDIYLAMSPNFTTDQTLMLLTFAYGEWNELYRSTDRGDSWHPLNDQLPFADARAFQISPNYAQDQTIFAASYFDRGLFRSQNNGQTWQNLYPDEYLLDFAVAPEYPLDSRLFVSIANEGVARSDNGGATWLPATQPYFANNNLEIALSPNFKNDNSLLAIYAYGTGGGVWQSTDAGDSWLPAHVGDMMGSHHSLSLSPQFGQEQTALVGIENRGVFITENAGEDWFLLDGIEWLSSRTANNHGRSVTAVAYWQGRPHPLLFDQTGYYLYFWPESTSAGFSCQSIQLERDEPQWGSIVVGARGVRPSGWRIHDYELDWLSVAPMTGMTPEYPQAQINTADLTEPVWATLSLDVYLSYRQRQTHSVSVFVPCFGQNLPLIRR